MRPLPDLSPLDESTSVYQTPQDDFLQLFGADLSEYDSLTAALDQQATSAIAGQDPISSAIDALDSSLADAIAIFDALSAADQAIDLTSAISDALSLDNALVDNFDSWAPDLGSIASIFLDQLTGFLSPIIGSIYGYIDATFQGLQNEIDDILFQWGSGFGTPS